MTVADNDTERRDGGGGEGGDDWIGVWDVERASKGGRRKHVNWRCSIVFLHALERYKMMKDVSVK
jgi:hypothetical protein